MQADLHQRKTPFQAFRVDFKDVDRAILDGVGGFVKILTAEKKDTILGATIVGPDAGNMISEVTVAMQAGMGLGSLASVIHPYPTQVNTLCLEVMIITEGKQRRGFSYLALPTNYLHYLAIPNVMNSYHKEWCVPLHLPGFTTTCKPQRLLGGGCTYCPTCLPECVSKDCQRSRPTLLNINIYLGNRATFISCCRRTASGSVGTCTTKAA